MAVSRSFKLGRYLGEAIGDGVIESDGGLSEASVTASGGSGVTTYTTVNDLPTSGNSAGDLAFVDSSDRLYIYSGAGWYSVSLVNATPSISSVLDSDGGSAPFTLSTEGANTVITVTATDSDGLPITYSAVTDSDFTGLASISQSSNVFTVTPFSEDSATTTSGSVTFKASDGINVGTSAATFTLTFTIVNSNYTTLLVKAEGNSGTNTSITDSSTNSHTITLTGDTQATSFSPYRHGGYSVYTGAADTDYVKLDASTNYNFDNSGWQLEGWVYPIAFDGGAGGIIEFYTDDNNTFRLFQQTGGFSLIGRISGADYVNVGSTNGVQIPIDQWNHFAITWDGSEFRYYLNGEKIGNASTGTDITSTLGTQPLYLAQDYISTDRYMHGYMHDVRLQTGSSAVTYTGSSYTVPTSSLTTDSNTKFHLAALPYAGDKKSGIVTFAGNTSVEPFAPYDHNTYSKSSNGGSIYFDGTGDSLTVPSAAAAVGTSDFTIEFWVYMNDVTSDITFFGRGVSGGNFDLFIQYRPSISNNLKVNTQLNTYSPYDFAWTPSENVWYHIAISRSGTDLKAFVDGTQIGSTETDSSDISTSITGSIGYNAQAQAQYLDGYISDFRIEESALYTSAFTAPTSPLSSTGTKLHVKGTDASIYDAAQSNRLSVSGAISSTTQRKFSSSSAIVFDGTNDQIVTVPNQNIELGSKDFTFETWFWHSSTPATADTIFEICPTTTRFGPLLFYYGGSSWTIYSSSNGTSWNVTSSFSVVSPTNSQWYHVAIAREGSSMKVFVDGTQVGSTISTSGVTFADSVVRLGYGYISSNGGNGNYFDGYIQDPRLTIGLARYTTTFTPPTTSLQG